METRSKKTSEDPGSGESQSQETSAKQTELGALYKTMNEKEKRILAQQTALQKQRDDIEVARIQLERDREKFHRAMSARENEVLAKERELEQRARELSSIREEASGYSHQSVLPREPQETPRGYYDRGNSFASLPPSGGGSGGSGGGEIPTPKVSFREATESVPSFDGYNIPLAQFTRACRRAQEIIPPTAERNLTKLLINKLSKRAYYAVEDEPCDTVTELIDLLTGAFGSPKTLDQYRGELSTTYLRPNEHILDYISRIKDLRTAILDAERRNRRRVDPHFHRN